MCSSVCRHASWPTAAATPVYGGDTGFFGWAARCIVIALPPSAIFIFNGRWPTFKSKFGMHFSTPEIDDRRYLEALLRHTEVVLRLFVGERLINKIFAKVFQSHAMGRLVIAHFDWRAGAGPRPTLRWLEERCGCGRTLAAFVAIARTARLIYAEADPEDARRKHLVPSERIVEGLRAWLQHHLEMAVALSLMPEGAHLRLREDPEYFERYVRASIIVIDALAVRRDRFPLWQWFDDHECGLRIAYALLREHCRVCLQAEPPVDTPVPLELTGAAIAQMLGLSKSHVRNVLNGAEKLGALIHDERRRHIRLSIAFLAEARASFVHLLTLMALAHQRAGVLGREHRLEVGRDENA